MPIAKAAVSVSMSSAELLLAWAAKRTAERKPGISMSTLGSCRKKVGYLLAGTPPSNPGESVQAAIGSATHEKIADIAREMFPNDLIEFPVEFAGIRGTLDRYDAETQTVVDTKTTSEHWLGHLKLHGADHQHVWQASMYGAGVIATGRKVKYISIHYLCRDTGEEWIWTKPFDPMDVRDALEWLQNVQQTDLGMLPRDYEPDGPFCGHCQFLNTCWQGAVPDRDPRSVLFVEDPDAAKWADELWDLRQQMKELEKRETRVKKALDAIRPDDGGHVQAGDRFLDFRRNPRNPAHFSLYFVPPPKPKKKRGGEK